MNIEIFEEIAAIAGSENVKKDEPMSRHTTFRIGGKADCMVMPQTAEQVSEIIKLCRDRNIEYYVVGNGSNILVRDEGYRGVIIHIGTNYSGYEFIHAGKAGAVDKENVVYARVKAGTGLIKFSKWLCDNSLTGMEFATGIPGTVGGAICMNAGAYGGEIKDCIVSALIMDNEGNVRQYSAAELELGYRTSIVAKNKLIVLEAVFALKSGNGVQIKNKVAELSAGRKEKQPLEYPSAGSTFKRPDGYFAGKLIADAGLKGCQRGGAAVSEKHAGFVINKGNATAKDVLELTDYISEKIMELNNVKLELEIKVL